MFKSLWRLNIDACMGTRVGFIMAFLSIYQNNFKHCHNLHPAINLHDLHPSINFHNLDQSNNCHNNNINDLTLFLYCALNMLCKLKGADHCTSAKRMTSILRYVAEAFPPAKQWTIINSHRVIGMATNTSMVLNCVLVTYIMMTADVGLPDAV